jgi:uncharacterized protein DUF3107
MFGFGTAPARLERPGATLGLPHDTGQGTGEGQPDQEDEKRMEVKLGVTYSPKELVVEVDQSPDDVASLVEEAVAGKSKVLWLSDTKGRRVGVPTEKLAYVEVGEEHPDKRVGFSSL